ncbi:MAG: lamin tail domain-containing protein [Verrucomicrobia bacterium]|nr:lamin tail domain-containing protein [Verrucomicrobiota bacterium]
MNSTRRFSGWLLRLAVGFLLVCDAGLATRIEAQTILSPRGSVWRYHNLNVDLGTGWRTTGYDDSAWSSGAAPLGGGDAHIATAISIGPSGGRFPTLYFRRSFSVVSAGHYEGLILRVLRDDGAAVYLNGTLLAAEGVAIPSSHDQFATQIVDGANETTYFVYSAPANALVDGVNVLAVEVKQANPTSSDLGFDLELEGLVDETPPELVEVQPPPGTVVPSLEFIRVLFDEGITGIDADDLRVNGQPATALTFLSNREYDFAFPPPLSGLVEVAWAPDHGITDDGPRANAFAGGTWSYTVDPEAVDRPNVILSEFLAVNASGIRDEDGTRSDWIELRNLGPVAANLEGWFLTDDPADPTQWRFPEVHLGVGDYLRVWASGKDRRDGSTPLHTSFQLSSAGEYLALLNAQTNVVSEFAPAYPPQQPDISYGRDRIDPTLAGYFLEPTPGAPNATSGPGFAEPPAFSLESGVYGNASLTLTITAAPGTTLRQTFDGSIPTSASALYTGPIGFSTNLMIKVRAFPSDPEWFPSPVLSRTFVLLDSSTVQFSSALPMVVISTPGRAIPQNVPPGQPRQAGTLLVVDTFRGRGSLRDTPDFHGWAEFEIFGQTSAGFPKRPHRIEIQDELRNDRSVPLLGMPPDGDWRLRNPYSDKCLMNDFLAFELFEEMGRYSVRRRLVEVFVNTTGGKLSYPRDYYGVMVLLENIERGSERVNIARLGPEHTQEPEITGGYMWKKDKDSTGDLNFSTTGGGGFSGQQLKIHEPEAAVITSAQLNWLRTHLNRMEQALYAPGWLGAAGTDHYSHYLDLDSLVDQHWIVEFTKQIDGYRLSNYMRKDRGGKIGMEPIWDWNLAFGNADYLEGGRTNGWYYSLLGESEHIWLRRLINGTTSGSGTGGDPDFNQRIADRWSALRTNVFSSDRLLARIDELAAHLSEAAGRDFARFPRLGSYVWPNPNGAAGGWHVDYVTPITYDGIIREMKQWVAGRYRWIDSQFTPPPQFNHPGGAIPNEFRLELGGVTGATLYYTLDGSDPRAPGGGIAPGALTYTGPIVITENVKVFGRARRAGAWQNTWSGPALLALHTGVPPLRITELMYHPPPPPAGSPYEAQDFEYIEVKNLGSEPLDLRRFQFTRGIRFEFTGMSLEPGQRAIIVGNRPAFESRYGAQLLVAGEYEGRLDNAGEQITLIGPRGEPIHDFAYDGNWHPIANGFGFSIVAVNETAPLEEWQQASGWRPSGALSGSPATEDPPFPDFPPVRVNEVLTRPTAPMRDAIELHNAGSAPADISGWFLTDDYQTPKKFRIPDGMELPVGGFFVFSADDFGDSNPGTPFGLSAQGEDVYLFSGNAAGELTGYVHGFDFGAAEAGATFGRYVISTGEEHFVTQAAQTLGGVNDGPRTGPIVISEILYEPLPVFANGAFWNNTEDEYLELYNLSSLTVALEAWELRDAVRFDFPQGTFLPADTSLLVVAFDPAADPTRLASFRATFGVPPDTLILGPFEGNLNNGGETISLSRADSVPTEEGAVVSWILMDQVGYSPEPPWPDLAAGQGDALHRVDPAAYCNDPIVWIATTPGPGIPPSVDSDADGMPDLWELGYGFDPGDPADALLDHDDDGQSNLGEYLAGTDPLDPESRLRIEEIRVGASVTLRFTAVSRRGYTVQFKDDLTAGNWTPLIAVSARAETRTETVADLDALQERYYRLVLDSNR